MGAFPAGNVMYVLLDDRFLPGRLLECNGTSVFHLECYPNVTVCLFSIWKMLKKLLNEAAHFGEPPELFLFRRYLKK